MHLCCCLLPPTPTIKNKLHKNDGNKIDKQLTPTNSGFYIKNGYCNYSGRCQSNHPPIAADDNDGDNGGGGGAGGSGGGNGGGGVELNAAGLPLRPGAKVCATWASKGQCAKGAACPKHHPPEAQGPPSRPASRAGAPAGSASRPGTGASGAAAASAAAARAAADDAAAIERARREQAPPVAAWRTGTYAAPRGWAPVTLAVRVFEPLRPSAGKRAVAARKLALAEMGTHLQLCEVRAGRDALGSGLLTVVLQGNKGGPYLQ